MKYFIIYILTLIVINFELCFSQNQYSSYEGTHFFVGFMQNEITIDPRYGGLHLKLFIFPSSTTDITVIFPNDSVLNFTNVSPSKNLEIDVPIIFENYESEVVRKKAIEIISTNPILVYGFSTQYLTSDAYTAIPVEKWGKEYVVISIANDQYNTASDAFLDPADSLYRKTPRQSEFLLIAAYDSTNITFYPRSLTEKGAQIGYPKNVMLHKGQTYLVKSYPFPKGFGDLSGTLIRGDKPFGVLSGHVRTAIPQNLVPKWDSKNHLCEMLMPTLSWGREFITVPFGTSPYGDLIKITSYFPNTTITSISESGTQTYVLNGNYDVLEIPFVAEPRKWISDKPIQMAQFIMHSGTEWDSPNYDPAMTLVPPIEQFVTNVTFQTPANVAWNSSQFVAHFVNIIGTIDALTETYLNSTRIVDLTNNTYLFKLFGDTYFWANIQIPYGKYQIKTNKGKITGIVYGVGLADAYALVLGSSLVNPYIGDSIPPELVYNAECGKIQGYFFEKLKEPNTGINYIYVISDSTYNFTYFLENITDTSTYVSFSGTVVDPYKKGKIVIEVRDRNGNSKRLSYVYDPPSIQIPSSLVFTQVKPYDTLKKSVLIQNNGNKINVLNISFTRNDPRFRWYVNRKLPFELTKTDTVSIFVHLTPDGNIYDLYDTLVIQIDCNLTFKIPINVEFIKWRFKTIGYDFGKVYLGDTAIGRVAIVNQSELPITFDSLSIGTYPNIFKLIKNGKFLLKQGDTAFFDVKFIPNERKDFASYVVFYDELKVKPMAELKGIGVAPLVESIEIDFGKVRVGRSKDSIIYLVNSGNIDATIDFQNFEKFDLNFSGDLELNKVQFKDTLPLKIKFQPSEVGVKTQKAFYTIDWKYHPTVTIGLIGEGILPQINTQDAIFDTIFVNEVKTQEFSLVLSTGTDDLLIKEIIPQSGDFNSFVIDYSALTNIVLPPNSDLKIPITFKPEFVGTHQLYLKVVSNATPSDTFVTTIVKVLGFAIPRDTLNANLLVKYFKPEYVCRSIRVDFSVENTGNIPFPIAGTNFEIINFKITSLDTTFTGKILNPGEKLFGYLLGMLDGSGDGILRISIHYGENGDSLLFKEIRFSPPKMEQTLFIEKQNSLLRVGEQSDLILRGSFVQGAELPFNLQLKIETNNPRQIQFVEIPVQIELSDSKQIRKLPCDAKFSGNLVDINCYNLKIDEDNTSWLVNLPFRLYLTDDVSVRINTMVVENNCYNSFQTNTVLPIEPFCVFPLRDIELIESPILLNFYPVPIENELILEFSSQKNDFVLIDIFDNLGNMILGNLKINVKTGLTKEKINFSSLENGIYFVKLHFNNEAKHIMVIKLK